MGRTGRTHVVCCPLLCFSHSMGTSILPFHTEGIELPFLDNYFIYIHISRRVLYTLAVGRAFSWRWDHSVDKEQGRYKTVSEEPTDR